MRYENCQVFATFDSGSRSRRNGASSLQPSSSKLPKLPQKKMGALEFLSKL